MGNNHDASASLKEEISLLEIRQAEEGKLLKEDLLGFYEMLKPINLIKSTFDDISIAMENRKGVVSSLIGVLTGYMAQRVVIGPKAGIFKKLTGVLLNYGVAALVSKYAETLKIMGLQFLSQFINQKKIEDREPVSENKE